MDTKKLRQKILDLAIHGKLVPQDPNDEPASVLLERIKAEKERLIKEGKIKRSKKSAKTSDTPHYGNVPFEVPNNWAWTTLGSIGTWQAGGTPSRSNKSYYGGNIPWLKTGDLNDGLITNIPESITEEAVANSSAKINPTGSVLIAMYGATIGKLGILTFPATTNQACCACIEYFAITQHYLFYFLLSHRDIFIAKGGGGAQPNISKEIIVNTAIPLPPLAEQERIVTEIERWLTLIDQIEQDKTDLQIVIKQAKSKILDLAIHGKLVPQNPNDEPASELLKRINPKAEITCDNGHYPLGWCKTQLKYIADYVNGRAFKPEEWETNGLPIVRIQNLNDETAPYNKSSKSYEEKYLIHKGDLLFAWAASLGTYVWEKGDAWLNQHIFKVIPFVFMDKLYLYYSLESLIKDFYKESHGSGIVHITKKKFEDIECFVPPLAEQQRIVAKIEELFSILDSIQKSLEA